MTGNHRGTPPLVRFLGEDAGRGGPFALLGLQHQIQSDTEIHRARTRRLRQIECHPERSTPDADEVRLAVHSAATQLLDPALREQLAARWPEGTPVDLPKAWKRGRTMQRVTPALVRRARMIVGSSGGWNSVARRRLAHLARLNRISAMEMIQQLGAGSTSRSQAENTPGSANTPLPLLPEEPGGNAGWVPAYLLLGLLASVLVATILASPRESQIGSPAGTPELRDGTAYLPGLSGVEIGNTVERDRLTHYTAIAHELDRLVARARIEPEQSIARFREVYAAFVQEWISFPSAALQRAGSNVAVFVSRLDEHGIPPEQIAPLLAVAGSNPDRVMISSGMIDLTLSSSVLRVQTQEQLRAIRQQMSGAPIRPGAGLRASAFSVAEDLAQREATDDPDWWRSWLQGALQTSESDTDRTDILLQALSSRLRDGNPPGDAWRETAGVLTRALDWRAESTERYWLLTQFGASEVATPRLAMLTEALVTESSAPGVDQLMVLPRTANAPKREQIVARYRESWFPDQPSTQPGGQSTSPLVKEIRIAISSMPDRISNEQEGIEHSLTLARLTTAAYLKLDGHDALSEELLLNLLDPPALPQPQSTDLQYESEDMEWAERAVNCENAGELRPLLNELMVRDAIGISSAHAIVYLASRRTGADMRDLARAQVARYVGQIEVLVAIDHALNRPSSNPRIDEVVEEAMAIQLPSRNDSGWYAQVRRELLTRMGQAIADRQDLLASRLQQELARWHATRIEAMDVEPIDSDSPALLADQLNQLARSKLELLIAGSNRLVREREQADSIALARTARAGSQVQLYHVYQRQELAYLDLQLRARYPDTARILESVNLELNARNRNAGSALQQIAHTQRAIAQLLLIAMERGGIE
ncbi:MAG: hypothetical protein ACX94C_07165 [Phycisphaerales bacterium]